MGYTLEEITLLWAAAVSCGFGHTVVKLHSIKKEVKMGDDRRRVDRWESSHTNPFSDVNTARPATVSGIWTVSGQRGKRSVEHQAQGYGFSEHLCFGPIHFRCVHA